MKLTSPAFSHQGYIPERFTCEGIEVNPPLVFEDLPAAAKSLALIMEDPDATIGVFVHWVVFDIPVTAGIKEDSVPGRQGMNNSGSTAYCGPCPPSGTHRYFFKAFCLDVFLGLSEGISKGQLEKAMQGHILAQAELVGLYKRKAR